MTTRDARPGLASHRAPDAPGEGRVIGWSTKISEANRKLDAKEISEIQRRLSCGEKVCVLAADFGVHRTTLSKVKAGTYRGEGA